MSPPSGTTDGGHSGTQEHYGTLRHGPLRHGPLRQGALRQEPVANTRDALSDVRAEEPPDDR